MEDTRLADQVINDLVNEVEETPQEEPQEQQAAPQYKRGPSIEENMAAMRRKIADNERALQEERRLRIEAETKRNAAVNTVNIGDDDLVEGKHYKELGKKLAGVEEQMINYQNQLLETRIRSNFPDYETVVNLETIERLQREHPEISQALGSTTDKYAQAATAYKMIKSLGMYEDTTYKADKERTQDNLNKPRPLTSMSAQMGESPLSKANIFANGLTPELAAQLRKEMAQAIKNK
jgi:hypothetical protein